VSRLVGSEMCIRDRFYRFCDFIVRPKFSAFNGGIDLQLCPIHHSKGFLLTKTTDLIVLNTAYKFQLPPYYYGLLSIRSSFAMMGIKVSPGVIDSCYHGIIKVILDCSNFNRGEYRIQPFESFVQMLIHKNEQYSIRYVEDAGKHLGSKAGFGSTGIFGGGSVTVLDKDGYVAKQLEKDKPKSFFEIIQEPPAKKSVSFSDTTTVYEDVYEKEVATATQNMHEKTKTILESIKKIINSYECNDNDGISEMKQAAKYAIDNIEDNLIEFEKSLAAITLITDKIKRNDVLKQTLDLISSVSPEEEMITFDDNQVFDAELIKELEVIVRKFDEHEKKTMPI
jgi:dUTPase